MHLAAWASNPAPSVLAVRVPLDAFFGASVRYYTAETEFPPTTRKSFELGERWASTEVSRIGLHNDSIYGFRSTSSGTLLYEYELLAVDIPGDPLYGQLDMAVCRESFTGTSIVCGPDTTRIHTTTLGTPVQDELDTAGVAALTNSFWDYYFLRHNVLYVYPDADPIDWATIRPRAYSLEYHR